VQPWRRPSAWAEADLARRAEGPAHRAPRDVRKRGHPRFKPSSANLPPRWAAGERRDGSPTGGPNGRRSKRRPASALSNTDPFDRRLRRARSGQVAPTAASQGRRGSRLTPAGPAPATLGPRRAIRGSARIAAPGPVSTTAPLLGPGPAGGRRGRPGLAGLDLSRFPARRPFGDPERVSPGLALPRSSRKQRWLNGRGSIRLGRAGGLAAQLAPRPWKRPRPPAADRPLRAPHDGQNEASLRKPESLHRFGRPKVGAGQPWPVGGRADPLPTAERGLRLRKRVPRSRRPPRRHAT